MTQVARRTFVGTAAAAATFSIVPRHVLGGPRHVSPNEKLTLAHIGMGTQGFRELGDLLEDPQIQIVAVCDPNTDSNDYVEWGKGSILRTIRRYLGDSSWRKGETGCPGGREVGRQVVDGYYARQRGRQRYKACRAYADFRELLEKEDVDAVKVMTPDFSHAIISVMAMRKGKHVLMHKPLANRLAEGRLVVQTARQTGVATHLMAYGVGAGNAAIAKKVREGVIGKLLEIHNWSNRPVWPQYAKIPEERPPIPKGFDWDLWLGPERYRPYHPCYTHTVFRGWYDFGGGSMADMGIYSLWPVFTTLQLGTARAAQAWGTHQCEIVDHVSRVIKNDYSYPIACAMRFWLPAGFNNSEIQLFWYDGGMKPRLPEELDRQEVELSREGILFVGDEGCILAGFMGQNPQLFRKGRREPLPVEPTRPAHRGPRHKPWLRECQGGERSPGSFLTADSITDTVNLGTVALRTGRKILFDSEAMKVTNVPEANKYLRRECREGWQF